MWDRDWRRRAWDQIQGPWDLIVIGGGITGAGILREASRAGLRTLLLEARDFASGTSSRSSKMVHGGFRYLRNGQVRLTHESVREREHLLRQARGLISPLGFLMLNFKDDRIPSWVFGVGLAVYDLLALKWGHQHYDAKGLRGMSSTISGKDLIGGYRYLDAKTDDARLVLRLLQDAVRDGGLALNYTPVERLLTLASGQVSGVLLRDASPSASGGEVEVHAPVIINATGAWADTIRRQVGGARRLRKLRGSHIIFPTERISLSRAVSIMHPADHRPVFAFPWEGVTVVGTTDIDHSESLDAEPCINQQEVEYLMEIMERTFPALGLTTDDIQSSFSGIRSVVDTGKANPSKESREHVIWQENGLLTITGGKLTTFRLMAHQALRAVRRRLPHRRSIARGSHVIDQTPSDLLADASIEPGTRLRLIGRYGPDAAPIVGAAKPGEMDPIQHTPSIWAELRWAALSEAVEHLDDLLLRRLPLALTLPRGGLPLIDQIRRIAQPELGWDDKRWEEEVAAYERLWKECHSIPT